MPSRHETESATQQSTQQLSCTTFATPRTTSSTMSVWTSARVKTPSGSPWSNRTGDNKCFKNMGAPPPRMEMRLLDLLRWQWQSWRGGLPRPPRIGYDAFRSRWCCPNAARQAVRAVSARSSTPRDAITAVSATASTTRRQSCDEVDRAFWLGHATSLLCLRHGVNVLIDPIFSRRASPVSFAGPLRRVPPPLTVGELPRIDVVAISHNHYDHLDAASVTQLHARFPAATFVVPLGIDRYLRKWGIAPQCIVAMDWWDECALCNGAVVVACTPAQHWSLRVPGDRNMTLWCGWCIGWRDDAQPLTALARHDMHTVRQREHNTRSAGDVLTGKDCGGCAAQSSREVAAASASVHDALPVAGAVPVYVSVADTKNNDAVSCPNTIVDCDAVRCFYFTGDTGYSHEVFAAIHARYPHIALAALPIGAYEPRWALAMQHMNPSEAADAFLLLRPRRAYGVHWGTFELGLDALDDPPRALEAAVQQRGITQFGVVAMGECITF